MNPGEDTANTWYLEGQLQHGLRAVHTALQTFPFRVGRRQGSDLAPDSQLISQRHAELFLQRQEIWVRDLGSTNGTFINGQRISNDGEHRLEIGDIVQFADFQFRLVATQFPLYETPNPAKTLTLHSSDISLARLRHGRQLQQALEDGKGFGVLLQPLVRLTSGEVIGYEALSRCTLSGTDLPPDELFSIAESLALENRLSVALRQLGASAGKQLPGKPLIFLNTHPNELNQEDDLCASLIELRREFPKLQMVLEIHEAAVADLAAFGKLRRTLEPLDIDIAFDDFGTGQNRLLELTDLQPKFVKFAGTWIKDLHQASRRKHALIESLVQMVVQMGSSAVAEGVENEAEAQACQALGFEFGQGYHLGRPDSTEHLAAKLR